MASSDAASPRRKLLAAVGAITLLGAILRFATLDVQSYWFDEAFTVVQLRWPFHDMIVGLDRFQATPPLYYVIASPWTALFGDGEVGLRSLSALCGTAAIPVTYAAGARLTSPRAGVIAALLVAVSPLLVWYSQEARPYSLLTLFAALSMWLFARALDTRRPRDLVAWAVVSSLAIAAHYFAAFLVIPAGVWLVARLPDVRRWAVGATVVVTASGLALLPLALAQRSNGRGDYIADLPLKDRITQVVKQLVASPSLAPGPGLGLLALVLILAGLVLLLVRSRGRERSGGVLALGLAATTFGVPVLMAVAGYNYLLVRNIIAGWVPLAVAVGAGLACARVSRAGAGVLAAAMAAIVILVAAKPGYQRDDWRGAAHYVDRHRVARAIVVSPEFSRSAAQIYLRDAITPTDPNRRFPIRELVVMGTARGHSPHARPAALGTLRLTALHKPQRVGVAVFRLDRPRRVSGLQLKKAGLVADPRSPFFQTGR